MPNNDSEGLVSNRLLPKGCAAVVVVTIGIPADSNKEDWTKLSASG